MQILPSDLHEDNDSGCGVVELAVGIHQTYGVHQWGKQRADVTKICQVQPLKNVSWLVSHKYLQLPENVLKGDANVLLCRGLH